MLASIWFFFWAKNGGCIWRKGDWDEYKSTVLRRKGPDGRTLSNATTSTNLGGGSIRGYDDDGLTYTDLTEETATTISNEKAAAAAEAGRRKKNKKKFKENAKDKLLRRNRKENWEGEADDDMRAYRQEKPARVGGINREAEGTYYGTEYTPSSPPTAYTETEVYQETEDGRRRHQRRDTRNVSGFSFTAGTDDVLSQATEEHLIRDPAQTRRDARRQRRHDRERESRRSRQSSPRKQSARTSMPGGYTEPLDFSSRGTNSEYQYSTVETEDSGTKSYHHPIPGLSKGYRRDRDGGRRRRDSLSDSE